MTQSRNRIAAWTAITISIIAILTIIFAFTMPHWFSMLVNFHRYYALDLIFLTGGVLACLFLGGYGLYVFDKGGSNAKILGSAAGIVVIIALWLSSVFGVDYYRDQSPAKIQPINYSALTTQWEVRAPIDTARAQAQFAIGDNPNATLIEDSLRYLPSQGKYNSLTHTRTMFKSYSQVLEQSSSLVGSNQNVTCSFSPDAKLWLGGQFFNSLGRKITSQKGHRFSTYSAADAYGYCEDNAPKVVVPLHKVRGSLIHPVLAADGVAVYDGKTGELEIRDSGAGIPGPTLARKVAENMIKSNRSQHGFREWVFNRVGYTPDSDADTDIVLSNNEKPEYVTKLVPARNSGEDNSPIAAIASMSAVAPDRGELPELTIHKLEDKAWRPDSAIDAKIRNDYSNLPNWQEFSIHEIIPVDSTHFVATIGNEQNVRYRVIGTGNLTTLEGQPEGISTCLYEGTSKEPIQCGQRGNRDGNSPGIHYESKKDNPGSTQETVGDKPLSEMTDKELIDSSRAILDELAKRQQ